MFTETIKILQAMKIIRTIESFIGMFKIHVESEPIFA